jgi:hypothetical protein
VVDTAGQLVETRAVAAEVELEGVEVEGLKIAYGVDADLLHARLGDFADAGDPAYGEGREEGVEVAGLDDEEAVWLAPVGGDFGEELVRGDAGGGGEGELFADLLADGDSDLCGRGEAGFVDGDVEVGLVEGEGFDEVSVALEDLADGAGDGLIAGEVRRDEDGLRAEAFGGDGGHGRADAVLAGLVGCGTDDGALALPSDDDGTAAEVGRVALLDGGVEGVHVDVDDLARRGLGRLEQAASHGVDCKRRESEDGKAFCDAQGSLF